MDLAVIIPLFNGERWIRQTLLSVDAQTRPPTEVLIVDDGSTDGSIDIVRAFPWVTFLRNPEKGAISARNFALTQTDAQFVALLDQDDVWHPEHVASTVPLLEGRPECPAALASLRSFRVGTPALGSPARPHTGSFDPWQGFPFNQIDTPSALILRRAALDRVGGIPLGYSGAADQNLWLKLTVLEPMLTTGRTTVGRRLHDESFSVMLRARHSLAYVEKLASASRDALEYRKATRGESGDVLQGRLEVFADIAAILEAIGAGEPIRVEEAARSLESRISDWPAPLVRLAFEVIVWCAIPLKARSDEHALGILLEAWPNQSRTTKKALLETAKQSVEPELIVRLLARRPFSARRWALGASALRHRLFEGRG